MTRDDLIASAEKLAKPSQESTDEFSAKREELALQVNLAMSKRLDLDRLVGTVGKQMSEDNNRNFARFMESLFMDYRPETLVDTALWVFRAYRSHGFHTTYWPANVNTWIEILTTFLSPAAFRDLSPYYIWLLVHIPAFVLLTDNLTDDLVGHTL